MKLHNIMEDKVADITKRLMKGDQDYCTCSRCKLDVIALALNEVKPKYVVTDKGELYGRANLMTNQSDADIIKEVTKAIEIVRESPRHDGIN